MSIGSNERLQTLASCGAAALVLWVGVFALDLGCFRGVAAVLARQRQPAARAARLLGPSLSPKAAEPTIIVASATVSDVEIARVRGPRYRYYSCVTRICLPHSRITGTYHTRAIRYDTIIRP